MRRTTVGRTRVARMGIAVMAALALALPVLSAEAGEESRQQAIGALNQHIAVLEDVKSKVPEGAQDDIQRAIDESRVLLDDLAAAGNDAAGDGSQSLEQALSAVDEATQRHIDMLEELQENEALSDEARAAIARAIDVSATGRLVAMERLQMLRSGDTPRGRPDAVRPSDIRPEGVRPDAGQPDLGSRPSPPPRPGR